MNGDISMNLDNNKGEVWAESKQSRPSLLSNILYESH